MTNKAPKRIWADVNEVTLRGAYDVEPFDDAVEFVRADLSPSPEVVKELVEALRTTRDRLLSHLHNELDGVWSERDFLDEVKEADAALAKLEGGE